MGVEDWVQLEEIDLSYYVQMNSSERVLEAVKIEGELGSGEFWKSQRSQEQNLQNSALRVGRVNPFTVKSDDKEMM